MSVADRLRGGRSAVARGALGLDHAKAREKMRMFRLPDPHYYVVQFVRAASALGATRINFEISTRQVRCSFDRTIEPNLLSDIWAVAMEHRADDQTRAVHYLALGFGSAQALSPAFIELHSGPVIVRLTEDEETVELGNHINRTEIFVREKFQLGHVLDFFSLLDGEHAEVVALLERCLHARLELTINSVPCNLDYVGFFTQSWSTAHGEGDVRVSGAGELGKCVFTRDGVRLWIAVLDHHGQTGWARVESSLLKSDLTGLNLAASSWDQIDPAMHASVYPHYHAALAQWLNTSAVRTDEALSTLVGIITYITKLIGKDLEPSEETLKLLEELSHRPLLPDALRANQSHSLNELTNAGTIHVARHSFFDQQFDDPRQILLAENGRMGLEGALSVRLANALHECPLYTVVDVTNELSKLAKAKQRREIWLSQEPQVRLRRAMDIVVEHNGSRGGVFFPSDHENAEVITYVNGRTLRRSANPSKNLSVWVDGDFTVRSDFSDIVIDDNFIELYVSLAVATVQLHRELGAKLVSEGLAESVRPRRLDQFVAAVLQGKLLDQVQTWLGLRRTYLLNAMARHRKLAPLTSLDLSPGPFLDWLGPIAEVESLELANGGRISLKAAVGGEQYYVLPTSGRWRAQLLEVLPTMSSRMIIADALQLEILRSLGVAEGAQLIHQHLRRADLLKTPPGKPLTGPDVTVRTLNDIEARVQKHEGSKSTCLLTFLWRGRLLEDTFVVIDHGSYRATVESERFMPNLGFGILRDPAYDDARRLVETLVAEDLHNHPIPSSDHAPETAREAFLRRPLAHELRDGPISAVRRVEGLLGESTWYPDPGHGAAKPHNAVTVLMDERQLEAFDQQTPFGIFTTRISGTGFGPDATYSVVEAGRDQVLRVAELAAAACVRRACQAAAQHSGSGTSPAAALRLDMLTALGTQEFRPPFDVREELESAPIFEMGDGSWRSKTELSECIHDGVLYWGENPTHAAVLVVPRAEVRRVTEAVRDIAELRAVDATTQLPRRSRSSDPLDQACALLEDARGSDWRLFDEQLASSFQWSETTMNPLVDVNPGVNVRPTHPLSRAVRARGDLTASAFLASTIYSSINAYYREITDHDELELQARLLKVMCEQV